MGKATLRLRRAPEKPAALLHPRRTAFAQAEGI